MLSSNGLLVRVLGSPLRAERLVGRELAGVQGLRQYCWIVADAAGVNRLWLTTTTVSINWRGRTVLEGVFRLVASSSCHVERDNCSTGTLMAREVVAVI